MNAFFARGMKRVDGAEWVKSVAKSQNLVN